MTRVIIISFTLAALLATLGCGGGPGSNAISGDAPITTADTTRLSGTSLAPSETITGRVCSLAHESGVAGCTVTIGRIITFSAATDKLGRFSIVLPAGISSADLYDSNPVTLTISSGGETAFVVAYKKGTYPNNEIPVSPALIPGTASDLGVFLILDSGTPPPPTAPVS